MNESKILTKHVSCDFKWEKYGRKWNSNRKWNNDKYLCECKNPIKHRLC